jgi:hypothetical protein
MGYLSIDYGPGGVLHEHRRSILVAVLPGTRAVVKSGYMITMRRLRQRRAETIISKNTFR